MTQQLDPQDRPTVALLDACAVLSLYATRYMDAILAVEPGPIAVVEIVVEEALYVRRVVEGDVEREPVDLSPLITTGRLLVLTPETDDELDTFVDLAVHLDDGEAMTAAVAIHRSCVLVTDDRKAERLLADRVQLRGTLDLIKAWVDVEHVPRDVLREALMGVYERGYQPSHRHLLRPW